MPVGMNGYDLFASLTQSAASLAWPGAFAYVLYAFKDKLVELLPHLKFKAGDVEVSFRLEKAEKEVEKLPPVQIVDVPPVTQEERDRFEEIAQISPRAAILELRNSLEETVKQKAMPHWSWAGSPPSEASFATSIRVLRKAAAIDAATSAILDDLRNIGNSITRTRTEVSIGDARRYRDLANEVMLRLDATP